MRVPVLTLVAPERLGQFGQKDETPAAVQL